MIIDAAKGGALMGKEHDEAYELLEEMASNSYQWQSERAMPRKAVGVHEIHAISAIHEKLALLIKKLDATNVRAIQTKNPLYDAFAVGQLANEGQVGNFEFLSTIGKSQRTCQGNHVKKWKSSSTGPNLQRRKTYSKKHCR